MRIFKHASYNLKSNMHDNIKIEKKNNSDFSPN